MELGNKTARQPYEGAGANPTRVGFGRKAVRVNIDSRPTQSPPCSARHTVQEPQHRRHARGPRSFVVAATGIFKVLHGPVAGDKGFV